MTGLFKALGDSFSTLADSSWFKAAAPLAALFLGWYSKRIIDWLRWSRRQFLHRVIVSLNSIENNKLLIRTIFEKSVEEVFLNSIAINMVLKAAQSTTKEKPLLELPEEDAWHILNSVLNSIAEEFQDGVVARDLGMPTQSAVYVICLTHEVADDIRQDKIRVMLVREDLLRNLPTKPVDLERPHHSLRLKTLECMSAAYQAKTNQCMTMEITLQGTGQSSLAKDSSTITDAL
jgi:hypothetical protein